MRFRIQYKEPNGKLFIDKRIFAKDEHDGIRVASNQFEYYFNELKQWGVPFEYYIHLRDCKLIIKEE